MDQKVDVKEEPVWLEGTANASFVNYEIVSEMTHLKEETKSELADRGQTQVNTFESLEDVKDEILIEEHTVSELDPSFKEEDKRPKISLRQRESSVIQRGSQLHSCAECGKSFRLKGNLDVHMLKHSNNRQFICSKSFRRRSNLKSHLLVHNDNRLHCCVKCGKSFYTKGYLKRHMVIRNGERQQCCVQCGKSFLQKNDLKLHSFEQLLFCKDCRKLFPRKYSLISGMLSQTNSCRHICSTCGKKFFRKKDRKVDLLVHSDDRGFICSECNKSFKTKMHLKGHMLKHSGERVHNCMECGRSFFRKVELNLHMLRHSGERM